MQWYHILVSVTMDTSLTRMQRIVNLVDFDVKPALQVEMKTAIVV